MTPGWLLEPVRNDGPRGMIANYRTRLIDLSIVTAFYNLSLGSGAGTALEPRVTVAEL